MSTVDAGIPPGSNRVVWLLRLWFGASEPVKRGPYALSGVGLMAFKYAVEAFVVWEIVARPMWPWQLLNPLLASRQEMLSSAPDWLLGAWLFWNLPFLWIAASMSIRRAADAGLSPWFGLLVLVPLANLVSMASLACLGSKPVEQDAFPAPRNDLTRGQSAALGVAGGLVAGGVMLLVSVYGVRVYGSSLFVGTPVLMGTIASYLDGRGGRRSWGSAAGIGVSAVFFGGVALLLFALEGVFCVVMAMPLMLPLGVMGGLLGKMITDATRRPGRGLLAVAIVLPVWTGGEALLVEAQTRVVLTRVVIDAPPEVVWQHVIAFPDLAPPDQWYFRYGIACPQRARIEGQGVGATRYCEFTTGTFVEPITVWDQPRRLAFDVTEQPEPMFELTPYRHVHPPHLEGALRSHRGEFRLIPLPDGRTRLEGRTWYSVAIYPEAYWSVWCDGLIGRIHQRVLTHIERLAEAASSHEAGDASGRL